MDMVARARINSRSRDTHPELNVPLVNPPGIRSHRESGAFVPLRAKSICGNRWHHTIEGTEIAAIVRQILEKIPVPR